ncbi:hypothetical protein QRX46_08230 [Bifidobacterium sp. H1HS10N]|uniref:hypothetical protein n=1 Tax=Bifidobacterium kimbladii TaxID=1293826 RepID=UPI0028BE0E14|nr:hypothetical protein [Bifidobacterium sp. H1HS10N]MDT7513401.1 hypothetical protein [Bifidobacterium sp. H1HS10N]
MALLIAFLASFWLVFFLLLKGREQLYTTLHTRAVNWITVIAVIVYLVYGTCNGLIVPFCDGWRNRLTALAHYVYLMAAAVFMATEAYPMAVRTGTNLPGQAGPLVSLPLICMAVEGLVELLALAVYAYDVHHGMGGRCCDRWWIRTTPYPVIGLIFLLFVNLWNDDHGKGEDFSLVFSVVVSVLAVNYLVQIINERIVPREGPYKKTYMAVYNRPVYNGPVCRPFSWNARARWPKPSPSAGPGEGAC